MLQLWKARQGRRAAVAAIGPLVERSHSTVGGIPARAWHDAYLLGFLSMLASLQAWKTVGPVSSQALGMIQAETLAELSGEVASIHGEEICILSMDQDRDFGEGCQQATLFHAVLEKFNKDAVLVDDDWPYEPEFRSELHELWKESFEARLSALR